MGRLDGKVALITGAARGQGRSHAVRLAEEGAQIIAIDSCEDVATVAYPLAREEELSETVSLVEALDRRIVAKRADVRDSVGLKAAVDEGVAELGGLDIVSANAGIFSSAIEAMSDEQWQDMIDINLTGVFKTCRAAIPHLVAAGGGSLILTSSTAGIMGFPGFAHYTAAKHGVVGYMRSMAKELAPHNIRVNCVCPTSVLTPMITNEGMYELFCPDIEAPTLDDALPRWAEMNLLPVAYLEPRDISNAVLFLASDEARYITSVVLPVDAGATQK